MASRVFSTQGRPSRHGVHHPQLSWAKKCSMLWSMSDGAGLVVEDDHGAGAEPAAGVLDVAEVHRQIQVLFEEKWGRCAAGQTGL